MDEATKARFDSVDACLSEDLARINTLAMTIEHTAKANLDILSRVEALEAAPDRVLVRNQTGGYLRAGTPVYADPLVSYSIGTVKPIKECGKDHIQVPSTTVPTPPPMLSDKELVEMWCNNHGTIVAAHRALYDNGFQHGLAAGRAEQGGTPEPTHPQYFSSHHAIAGEIWGMLPDAPEPNQAPAGDGGLVDTISDIIGNEPIIGRPCPAVSAVILAVAKWLRGSGHFCAATDLEREAHP